tara:strand:- start:1198 stop:1698 length:501 start_codon:yes stop_codon:yes gene_type:complete
MNLIIQSTLKTLQKSEVLLNDLSNKQLCDASVPPYHSSIGTHIRHILDFYHCIFNVNSESKVDLTARSRSRDVESDCECAKNYLNSIIKELNSTTFNVDEIILVIDDLGLGKTEIPYTYGSLLTQANSHTIHHYAIINYIFDSLGIVANDSDFGYNPSTPKEKELN